MGQEEKKIIDHLHELGRSLPPVVSGVVKSVDEDNALISVELTRNEPDAITEGVMLSTVKADNEGIILIPEVGARCILAAVDTDRGIYTLIRASAYSKKKMKIADRMLEVKAGQWIFDGGDNGGIPIEQKIMDNLNAIKQYLDAMNIAIATGLASAAGMDATAGQVYTGTMTAQLLMLNNMENEKIKH